MLHGFLPVLLVFVFISATSWVSAMMEEMPMQLSQAELVRMAGYGDERLSSVLVAGTLRCEACLEPGSPIRTSVVSSATIAVACKTKGKRRTTNWANGTTDEYGEFIVDLPSQLHAIPRLEKACIVRVLCIPKSSLCQKISGVKGRHLKLSSVGNGIRVYTAANVRLRHKIAPAYVCSRKRDSIESTW